jgi:hypothetical protein
MEWVWILFECTMHQFSTWILLTLLCRLLTYSKLLPASAYSYLTQSSGCVFAVIDWGQGSDRWVCLGGGKDTPTSNHTQKPMCVWLLLLAASISWGANQETRPNQKVQFLFKLCPLLMSLSRHPLVTLVSQPASWLYLDLPLRWCDQCIISHLAIIIYTFIIYASL